MNTDDVRERLTQIHEASGDPEYAHSLEDALYRDVLEAIARGEAGRAEATVAFLAGDIDFPRWCA